MATGDVITTVPIPGLQRPFTKYDMKESTVILCPIYSHFSHYLFQLSVLRAKSTLRREPNHQEVVPERTLALWAFGHSRSFWQLLSLASYYSFYP
ncbi:hypothetical protein CEP51_014383 [Fusarium floridanum]|uniref:Uncharacterized protein n=1 Tax=Fusarium floridanum TaxID=1325733 RepID=A0A428PTW6_9HYPO|nr:hypothetical protein CEP51_014383 [Fusarium floridanum]